MSIKNLLSEGEDREKIKEIARELSGSPLWRDVIKLFRQTYPRVSTCKCGEFVTYHIHPFTLEERPYCKACSDKEEKEQAEKAKELMVKAFLQSADSVLKANGVPKMFLRSRITDFPAAAKKYITMNKGLYLTGDRGTGKTHFAVAIMRGSLEHVTPVDTGKGLTIRTQSVPAFVSVPEMLLEIRQSYSENKSSEKTTIDKYTERNLLIMDDLGVEKTTEWAMQILYIIIDRRYRDEKRTIITSNLSLDELSAKLDDRVASRIAGMCMVLPMKGADRRLREIT